METFELNAQTRTTTGSAESRRLRRRGRVPAIIYGGKGEPLTVTFDHDELHHQLGNEAFFSHVIKIRVDGGNTHEAVLRDLQRHPARPFIEHVDFLRIIADEKLRMSVPLHIVGAQDAPGVKAEEGIVQHILTEVEIECLPRDLPEHIDVDVSALHLNETLHLSDLALPAGVHLVALLNIEEDDESADSTVVSVQLPRAAAEETEEAAAAEAEAAAQATGEAAGEGEATADDGDADKE